MTSAVLARDALMPRPPGGMGPGLLLALMVHGLLVIALALGVHWHASEPEGVTAELWASVPQIAAPKAVEPEPVKPEPPAVKPLPKPESLPDAQIAIEKARREEQERKKKEQVEKQKKEQEDKRKQLLEDQKLAALREQQLKRMMGQAGALENSTTPGDSNRSAGPSATYAGRIVARIKPNVQFPVVLSGNPRAEVEIRLGPDGTILSSRLVKSSGSQAYDEAVLRGVEMTKTLPLDNGRNWSPILVGIRQGE